MHSVTADINYVVLAVLFAAAAQATWNLAVKSGKSPFLTLSEINFIIGVFALPLVLFTGLAPWPMMKWVAAAIILRQAYYLTLSRAYRFHDFSLAYPIMRGLNPVLVTGLGVAFLGDRIGLYGGIGIALIAAGIVVSASSRSGAELHLRMPLLLVCLAASVEVSLFLFVDGIGVRATMHSSPGSYAATMAILDGAVSGAIILWSRTSQNMGFTKREVQQSVAGGLLASFAFWIGIWAISVAPIGMVSALRETSILFALLLSVIFLKERLSFGRLLGAATILAGIVLIRVGA